MRAHARSESKQQHVVPQVLMRMFRASGAGKKARAWEFARDRPPALRLVKDIGHANRFYGPGHHGGLEHALGSVESALGAALKRIAETKTLAADDLRTVLTFLASLTIRTKHLRAGMENEWNWVMRTAQSTLCEPQNLAAMVAKGLTDRRQLRGAMRMGVTALPHHGGADMKLVMERQMYDLARAARPEEFDLVGLGDGLEKYLSGLSEIVASEDLAAKAQRQVMERELVPEGRVRILGELEWRLHVDRPWSFVLGDSGPLAKSELGHQFRSFLVVGSAASLVVMPLAHDLALVGTRAGVSVELDAAELNRAQAANSHEFFVSSSNGEREQALHGELGAESSLFRGEEREPVVKQLRDHISQGHDDVERRSDVAEPARPLEVAVIDETDGTVDAVFIAELRRLLWSWSDDAGPDRVLIAAPARLHVRVVPDLAAALARRSVDGGQTRQVGEDLIWFEEIESEVTPSFQLLINGRRLEGGAEDSRLRVGLARAVLWHLMHVVHVVRNDESNQFARRELPFARDQVHLLGNRFLRNLRLARCTRDAFDILARDSVTVTSADGTPLPLSEAWAEDDTRRFLSEFHRLVGVLAELSAGTQSTAGAAVAHLLQGSRAFLNAAALAFGTWTEDEGARMRRNAILQEDEEFMATLGTAWVDEVVERAAGDHLEHVDLVSCRIEDLWARFGLYLGDRGGGRWELLRFC